jgi:recombination protein RecA
LPTGVEALDRVLGGGLPRGRLVELAGRRSTGRTGLACAIAARATRSGEIVGWVDPTDALDPETVVTTGIAPTRVLWVRPRTEHDAPKAAECLLGAGGFGLVVLDLAEAAPHLHIPWARLAHAAERSRTTVLVLMPERRAGPHAALGLELSIRRAHWSRGPGRPAMLDGIGAALTVARHRLGMPGRTITMRHACA